MSDQNDPKKKSPFAKSKREQSSELDIISLILHENPALKKRVLNKIREIRGLNRENFYESVSKLKSKGDQAKTAE